MKSCPHCGCDLVKPRSLADHRRFFAALNKAFLHWREGDFVPTSPEHLRAWLLVQAGYSDVTSVSLEWLDNPHLVSLARLSIEASVAAALGQGDFAFTRPSGNQIEVLRAKSISFSTLDQKAFGRLREKVEEIIEAHIGVKVDQLLREEAA